MEKPKKKLKVVRSVKGGETIVKKVYVPVQDNLKYYRIVRYYIMRKYKITMLELEMLIFLYSEGLFTVEKIKTYAYCFPWKRVTFEKMLDKGHIVVWREKRGAKRKFQLSFTTKQMIARMYNMLNGTEPIPERRGVGTMFMAKPTYVDKNYAKIIKDINRDNKGIRIKIKEPGAMNPDSNKFNNNSRNRTIIVDE